MNVDLDTAYWLGLAVSTVLPILVGLVTTKVTSASYKAVLLLALSVLNGFLTEWGQAASSDAAYDVGAGFMAALASFAVGVAMHFGLWKPVGVSRRAQAVGARKV